MIQNTKFQLNNVYCSLWEEYKQSFDWTALSVFMFLPETAVRFVLWTSSSYIPWELYMSLLKDLMKGKLFQRCTHLLYLGVLSLGGNVSTRRMSKPDMGSIFHINNQ